MTTREKIKAFFSASYTEPPEVNVPDPLCKHLKSYIRDADRIGYAYCPQCEAIVYLADVYNTMLNEMRNHLDLMDKLLRRHE